VQALAACLCFGGEIEEREQLEAPFRRRFGFKTDRQLNVDAVWRKDNVLVLAFENGFPQLITELPRLMSAFERTRLLIIDDWGPDSPGSFLAPTALFPYGR
jgi:hypothetical protein